MRSVSFVFAAFMLLGSPTARSQEVSDLPDDYVAPATPELAQPASAPPTEPPPAPPVLPPPSPIQPDPEYPAGGPAKDAEAVDPQRVGDGQWVYTEQYGWVFMAYGDQYVDEGDADDETPYAFVYYPGNAWVWVAAPWVWGWGAYPYFGATGPSLFGWYRGLYAAGYGWGGYRGGHNHPHVRRLGGTGLLSSGGYVAPPAPPSPAEPGRARPHYGGYFGGYWHNYPRGGYLRGSRFGGAGADRAPAAPEPSGGRPSGGRGGERTSSSAVVSPRGASASGRVGGSRGSVGSVVGASPGDRDRRR